MKGKNLERAVILGLLLSTGVYGTAWAEMKVDGDTLYLKAESSLNEEGKIEYKDVLSDDVLYDGKKANEFKKIIVDVINPSIEQVRGNSPWSFYLDAPDAYLKVTINGTTTNNDGIHLTRWASHMVVDTYEAYINSPTSDALNISHDNAEGYAIMNNLSAIVENGNGIRANASTDEYENTITINKEANITINSDLVTVKSDVTYSGMTATAEVSYNPAGVYAGDDMYNFNFISDFGTESKGQGIVNLNGDTIINTNGDGNYGIYAGKNGTISVKDVSITANGKDSIGIAAINSNLIYDDSMKITINLGFLNPTITVNQPLDTSINKYGSVVILNGTNNTITMAEGGKALYADAKNSTANDKKVIIKSGDNGIGNLDVKGDIVATNSGKIDLTVNKVADITGDIEATNSGIINFTLGDNAVMIVSEKDNTLINAGGVSKLSLAKDGNESKIGNVQAANGGTINLTLGDGAYFAGRVDDYKDAGEGNDNNNAWNNQEHKNVFDQEFAKNVTSSGTVNMTLGNNSTWFVTEQSWATTVTTNDSIIDLTNGANQNYAVHIGTLKGKAKFIVNLDPNTDAVENNGNMIYVYNGTEAKDLNLQINNEREVLTGLANGEKLRFATVANAGGGFGDTYVARGRGVINSGFSIEYEKYNTNNEKENDKYNGGTDFDETKPGSDYVDGIYGNGENVYLVRDTSKDAGKSDSGATIINMSRANYKNAIYMDRLNKRMGEMRYVNGEEEQGLWVRLITASTALVWQ